MAAKKEPINKQAQPEFVITRVFDAPRDLVWKAWTDPELFKRWWGPKDFTSPFSNMDLRPGGKYLYCMRSPDGKDYWGTGIYREIVPTERLVFTDSFADEKGSVVPASHYGMSGDWPVELLVTVMFEPSDNKTRMTLRHVGIPSGKMSDEAQAGWNESFDKLAVMLAKSAGLTSITAEPGKQEIVITRVFDAPRSLVFKAAGDPDLMPYWWGPKSLKTTVDKMEVRSGGAFRIVQRDPDNKEFAFHGVYHEVLSPERMIYTFEFEGTPGHVSLETVTFEDHEGGTKVTDRIVYQSVEDRDETIKSGMERGAAESMERFAELLEKFKVGKKAA